MIFYILFGCLFIALFIVTQSKSLLQKKISTTLIMILFWIVGGLSYKIHNDMYIYEQFYNSIRLSSIISWRPVDFEIGFVILNYIGKNILFLPFILFKALVYFFCVLMIFKGVDRVLIKNSNETAFLLILLYFFTAFYMSFFVTFRQAIAVSIFIYAIKYIGSVRFYFLIAVASLFHLSGILLLFIPLYIRVKRKSKWLDSSLIILIPLFMYSPVFSYIIALVMPYLGEFSGKIVSYGIGHVAVKVFGLMDALHFIIGLLVIFLVSKKALTKEESIIYKLFILYVILALVASTIPLMYRVLMYFQVFLPLGIVLAFRGIKSSSLKNITKLVVIISFFGLFNLYRINLAYKFDGKFIPYHSGLELVFYEIPYSTTAQYRHMIERWGVPNVEIY
ncbi:hypothetical protein PCNPT3_11700 [Psychromonas sp. CNPT3]|uniref:EpsG family protein n=1 Tax=Psychromonas sp. CNPT3 TaxID=314282 RepID=UPI0002C07ABC|nr:EpsG family protein [Psychromonas sp. CNPT3]AGH82276.1 hypothetical protein PCNPT3_11700 [Psychromonas sp. CNPT3]